MNEDSDCSAPALKVRSDLPVFNKNLLTEPLKNFKARSN